MSKHLYNEDDEDEEYPDVVEEARDILENDGEWGNEVTLRLAESFFNIIINIYNYKNKNWVFRRPGGVSVGWSGFHYNPLFKKSI